MPGAATSMKLFFHYATYIRTTMKKLILLLFPILSACGGNKNDNPNKTHSIITKYYL